MHTTTTTKATATTLLFGLITDRWS